MFAVISVSTEEQCMALTCVMSQPDGSETIYALKVSIPCISTGDTALSYKRGLNSTIITQQTETPFHSPEKQSGANYSSRTENLTRPSSDLLLPIICAVITDILSKKSRSERIKSAG